MVDARTKLLPQSQKLAMLPSNLSAYLKQTGAIERKDFDEVYAQHKLAKDHAVGCYIIYDKVVKKFYIQKAGNIYPAARNHIIGKDLSNALDLALAKGNHDYLVRFVELDKAGYGKGDLNKLHSHLMWAYHETKTVAIDKDNTLYPKHQNGLKPELLDYLVNHAEVYSLDAFNKARKEAHERKMKVPGCYIIYDQAERKYYVGQSTDIFARVRTHVNSKSENLKQLVDYNISVSNHPVSIKLVPITWSGEIDINKLERDLIRAYEADTHGYNKTSGGS